MIDRQHLRHTLKMRRRALSAEDIARDSRLAMRLLASMPDFKAANHVAIYSPFDGEIDPLDVFNFEKSVYLPIVEEQAQMCFVKTRSLEHMAKNRYGILEPVSGDALPVEAMDLIVVPLVAFNRHGDRLGMGAGYYDRALAKCSDKTHLVGMAYSWQEVEGLCSEHWDVPLHSIVTEREVIHCC